MDSGKDSPSGAPDKPLAPGELKPEQRDAIQTLGPKPETTPPPSSAPKVSRGSFLKMLGAFGLGALVGRASSGEATPKGADAPEPPASVEPAEGVPQDDVYPLIQPRDGSALAQANPDADEASSPTPDTVDGNNRAPGGGDVLPMTEDRSGNVLARAETGASPERNPLPVKGSEEEGLPMMPKGPDADVVAQAQTGAGAERNPPLPPSENQTEPLPKMGPRDDDPVNA